MHPIKAEGHANGFRSTSSRGFVCGPMDGVEVCCKQCQAKFSVCRHCWCGQRYCSRTCSSEARDYSHRISQAKYAQTQKGKESQRKRQRRYRLKRTKEKRETEQSTADLFETLKPISRRWFCLFCGCRIKTLIKRGSEKHFSFRRLGCLHQNNRQKS